MTEIHDGSIRRGWEVKTGKVTYLPTNIVVPKCNFNTRYKTIILGQEQWKDGSSVNATMERRNNVQVPKYFALTQELKSV